MNIRTLNDFILAISIAIDSRDMEALENIIHETRDWLVDANQRGAMNALMDTAINTIEALEDI